MLALALAATMAIEVRHDFIPLKDLNAVLEDRLNDGWEVVHTQMMVSYLTPQDREAKMLFVFKRGTP